MTDQETMMILRLLARIVNDIGAIRQSVAPAAPTEDNEEGAPRYLNVDELEAIGCVRNERDPRYIDMESTDIKAVLDRAKETGVLKSATNTLSSIVAKNMANLKKSTKLSESARSYIRDMLESCQLTIDTYVG